MLRLPRFLSFLILFLLLLTALLPAQPVAAQTGTIAPLVESGGPAVSGSVTVSADAQGNATMSIGLSGLAPGELAQVNLNTGTCAAPGPAMLNVLTMPADSQGRVAGYVPVMLYQGAPVKLSQIADGNHIVVVVIGGRAVACGAIPGGGGGGTSSSLEAALFAEAERQQVIQFNPNAALQKRIFADGFVPNSGEFSAVVEATTFVGQRAEHLGTGTVRAYFARSGDWGNVRYCQRGASWDAFCQYMLGEAERHQVIRFNPGAALQKQIFYAGFVPNSPEFTLVNAGINYTAQRSEHLGSGRVRVYYSVTGQWNVVRFVERAGGPPPQPPTPPPAPPPGTPAVSISPTSGPSGTVVRLTGAGFPAYTSAIAYGGPPDQQGLQLAASTTDGSGRVIMDVWVQGAPGTRWVFWIAAGPAYARSGEFAITQ